MTKFNQYMFGVDNFVFIDSDYNVYGIDDAQNATLNLQMEIAEYRGGANNDLQKTAVHTRNGELALTTGKCDIDLAKLLAGGSITSLGTSAASVITGSANGVNTLSGTSATICTGVTSVVFNSPTLVKTTDYYIKATDFAKIQVTRVEDGKAFGELTLTASGSATIDSERGIAIYTGAGAVSLTANEKAYVSVRSAINSINQKISFNNDKPTTLSAQFTVDFDGVRRQVKIPNVQPMGTMVGNSSSEFQIQEMTMKVYNSEVLNEIASMVLQG